MDYTFGHPYRLAKVIELCILMAVTYQPLYFCSNLSIFLCLPTNGLSTICKSKDLGTRTPASKKSTRSVQPWRPLETTIFSHSINTSRRLKNATNKQSTRKRRRVKPALCSSSPNTLTDKSLKSTRRMTKMVFLSIASCRGCLCLAG
jgi:hypothetical protein